jgi:hypothetical protein
MGAFAGDFAENRVLLWCFCGEVVVDCVANVVNCRTVFAVLKMGHQFQLYF